MKKLITILMLGYILNPLSVNASAHGSSKKENDTISVKCLLFSPNLFYGIELGEAHVCGTVDTLLNEIPNYDTTQKLKVVVVSARELGFKGEADIPWDEIMDSATHKGYGICPPQLGPELYVALQNIPAGRKLLSKNILKDKPLFIGMDKLRHMNNDGKKASVHSRKNKNYYDFVFCIESNTKLHSYELGYSVTDAARDSKGYIWSSNDMFIFISR